MNHKTKYLSQKEREIARKYYFRYVSLNGIGYSFLGNTTVYLLAILYGASNMQLGYISSAIYITGGFLVFYPRLFQGKSSRIIGSAAWLLRGLVCLGYLLIPFLSGAPAVWLILFIYTLFCITRTVGIALQQSIQKMISSSRTRGEVVMTASARFNSVALLSRIFSYGLTSLRMLSDLTGLLVLQVLGVLANTFSSINLIRMPNRETIDYKKGDHVGRIFAKSMKKKENRTILLLRWSAISIEILTAMTVPFLRQYAGFSTPQVFLYTLIITLAAIFAAIVSRPFADRLGSRPFILPAGVFMGILFAIWMTVSPNRSPEFFYILGFTTIYTQNILSLLTSRLFVQSIPDEGSVAYTSMDIVTTSALALFLGFLAGGLADLSAPSGIMAPLNVYGLTYALGLAVCIFITLTAAGFIEKGSQTLKKTWALIFSISHMRTFRDINRLEGKKTSHKRKTLILSLAYTGSSLANEEIRQMFKSPLLAEKSDILKSLFERKRPELIPDIIAEAQNPYSIYRQEAIFALGAYPDEKVAKALSALLDDPDELTASNGAKSLGRIHNRDNLSRIYTRYKSQAKGQIERDMNYMIALYNMDPQGPWLRDLFTPEQEKLGENYEQGVLTLACRLMDLHPSLGWIYQMENIKAMEGVNILLDETRERDKFFLSREKLEAAFLAKDYPPIWTWCQNTLKKEMPNNENQNPVFQSIRDFPSLKADKSNSIGALYFTYHILSREE